MEALIAPPPKKKPKKRFTGFFGSIIHGCTWLNVEVYLNFTQLTQSSTPPPPPPTPPLVLKLFHLLVCTVREEGGYFINHWSMRSYPPKANVSSLRGAILGDSERDQCGHSWDWGGEKKINHEKKAPSSTLFYILLLKHQQRILFCYSQLCRSVHFEH